MNIIRGSQPVRNYIAEKTHRGTVERIKGYKK